MNVTADFLMYREYQELFVYVFSYTCFREVDRKTKVWLYLHVNKLALCEKNKNIAQA